MKKIVSIIIPVYNAEKYIEKAVKSIKKSSEIEIILVDDGSIDESGYICDNLVKTDENILVIHKNNGGLSTARNLGIENASGVYISFIDADDFVDVEMYEEIIQIIKEYNPDCIEFGWKYINDLGEISFNISGIEKGKMLEKNVIVDKILPPLLNLTEEKKNFIYDFAVNKIYKKEIIDKYNIRFNEQRRTWEDRIFVVEYLKYCQNLYSINKCFYNYVSIPNSLSRTYDLQFFDIILENYKKYLQLFEGIYDFKTEYFKNYWCYSIEKMVYRSLQEKKHKEQIEKNIIKILKHPLVIKWYLNRTVTNECEARIKEAVVSGQAEYALYLYKKENNKRKQEEYFRKLKYKIKDIMRGFLKR